MLDVSDNKQHYKDTFGLLVQEDSELYNKNKRKRSAKSCVVSDDHSRRSGRILRQSKGK